MTKFSGSKRRAATAFTTIGSTASVALFALMGQVSAQTAGQTVGQLPGQAPGTIPPGAVIRVAPDGQLPPGAVEIRPLPGGVTPLGATDFGGQTLNGGTPRPALYQGASGVTTLPAPSILLDRRVPSVAQAGPAPAPLGFSGGVGRIRESSGFYTGNGGFDRRFYQGGGYQQQISGGGLLQRETITGAQGIAIPHSHQQIPGGYLERQVINGYRTIPVPIYGQGVGIQPIYGQPVVQQPIVQRPVARAPIYNPPVYNPPVYNPPVVQQPAPQRPIIQQPIVQQPAPSVRTQKDQPIRIVNNNYNNIRVVADTNTSSGARSTASAAATNYPMAAVATQRLNYRSCPSVSCRRIGTIPAGRKLTLTGCKQRWCSAVVRGRKCWVSRKFVGVRR